MSNGRKRVKSSRSSTLDHPIPSIPERQDDRNDFGSCTDSSRDLRPLDTIEPQNYNYDGATIDSIPTALSGDEVRSDLSTTPVFGVNTSPNHWETASRLGLSESRPKRCQYDETVMNSSRAGDRSDEDSLSLSESVNIPTTSYEEEVPLLEINTNLCKKCRRLLERGGQLLRPSRKVRYRHWDSVGLYDSWEQGCHLCVLIWAYLTQRTTTPLREVKFGLFYELDFMQKSRDEELLIELFAYYTVPKGANKRKKTVQNTIEASSEQDDSDDKQDTEHEDEDTGGKAADVVDDEAESTDYNSSEERSDADENRDLLGRFHLTCRESECKYRDLSMVGLADWKQRCCTSLVQEPPAITLYLPTPWLGESHMCRPLDRDGHRDRIAFRPTRLLYIGDPVGVEGHDLAIHLVDTFKNGHLGYATLSHQWAVSLHEQGNSMLTLNTLEAFKQCVPAEALDPTYRDAAAVVLSMGVKYLWLDSLCIVQDSPEDWRRESSLMSQVYSNAEFNICASRRGDTQTGLCSTRHPMFNIPCTVQIPPGNGYFNAGNYVFLDMADWTRNVEQAPINRRAWVLQERLLAPRVIHFCDDGVYWECRELQASERFPKGFPGDIAEMRPDLDKRINQTSDSFLDIWDHILKVYTNAHLTYPTDRLIAISGLARRCSSLFPSSADGYLAGLWRHELLAQLIWMVDGRDYMSGPVRPPLKYRAPSWSWASVEGPVRPLGLVNGHAHGRTYVSRSLVRSHSSSIEIDGDAFNTPFHCSLHVTAPLLRVRLVHSYADSSNTSGFRGERCFKLFSAHNDDGGSAYLDASIHIGDEECDDNGYTKLNSNVVHQPEDMYLLPITATTRTGVVMPGELDRVSWFFCLLLTPTRLRKGEYRRIGVGIYDMPQEEASIGVLCDLGNQEPSEVPCERVALECLRLEDFAPKHWRHKKLDLVPREYTCYEIIIV